MPITIDNPPTLPGSSTLPVNQTFPYFELGGEGVICWRDWTVSSASPKYTFPNLPRVQGDAFVWINSASQPNFDGESAFFRRQYGDMSTGVTIGPMLGLLELTQPQPNASFAGTIGYAIGTGPQPDLHEIIYGKLSLFGLLPLWQGVLPGSETSVTIPSNVLSDIKLSLKPTDQTAVLVISSRSPRFTYSAWNYGQIGFGGLSDNWTSYSYTIALVKQ